MNAGQHLGNTKAILENLDWFTDFDKIEYFQILNWSPDYLSLIDIVGKLYLLGVVDYFPVILPYLGRPLFNFFSMKKKIEFLCKNTIILSETQMFHRFHFDSITSFELIENNWKWLEELSKKWIEKANLPENTHIRQHMIISLLAQTLHVVQDFYSHSNWIEYLHNTFNYSKVGEFPTWFDIFKSEDKEFKNVRDKIKLANLYTGYFPIGKDRRISKIYHNDKKNKPGLNKDRSERPYFSVVYYLAYKNGIQWLNFLKNYLTKNDIELINNPLPKELRKLSLDIQPYIKKIAFKVREWNGTKPFENLGIKLENISLSNSDELSFIVKLSTSDKLIKYDRDFRKSFIKIVIRNEEENILTEFKFGKKSGYTKYKLKISDSKRLRKTQNIFLRVEYGLLYDEKLIIK